MEISLSSSAGFSPILPGRKRDNDPVSNVLAAVVPVSPLISSIGLFCTPKRSNHTCMLVLNRKVLSDYNFHKKYLPDYLIGILFQIQESVFSIGIGTVQSGPCHRY
jgi:hypothetical protein